MTPNKKPQFITIGYLKQKATIDLNVDDKLLTSAIDEAMDLRIQKVLGNALFVKLKTQLVDGVIPENYEILMRDYVRPATAYWALYYALPQLLYKLTNGSVVTKDGENSTAIDLPTLNFLRSEAQNKAEEYCKDLRVQILNSPSLFPEYSQNSGIGEDRPSSSTYTTSIYIRKRNRC